MPVARLTTSPRQLHSLRLKEDVERYLSQVKDGRNRVLSFNHLWGGGGGGGGGGMCVLQVIQAIV